MAADESAGRRVRPAAGAPIAPLSPSELAVPSAAGCAATSGMRPPVKTSQRFRRSDRLLDRRDFDRVLRMGRRRSSAELVVVTWQRPGGLRGAAVARTAGARGVLETSAGSRLGITVGRKAGHAVERNRFKRRVREWFRRHRAEVETELDIVVIARRPAVELSSSALGDRLTQLLVKPPARSR